MAISIKGTIAGLKVDLTVDGIDDQWLVNLAAAAKATVEVSHIAEDPSLTASNLESAPPPDCSESTAMQIALDLLTEHGEMPSCDLINALDENGISELEIKKTLMFLRERDDIFTQRSQDGNQRTYSKKE